MGVVGGEQLVEADQVLLSFDVVAVPEQQPRAFDHLAGWFVVGQAVGFVDADPVDHLAAELVKTMAWWFMACPAIRNGRISCARGRARLSWDR